MTAAHDLLKALDAAVYTTDAEGRLTFYNAAAARMWGREPQLGELWCGSWRLFKLDGTPLPHDECPMAIALRERRSVRGIEAISERPDGTRYTFIPYPTPLLDAEGNLTGAINLLVDTTGAREADEQRARLVAIVECSDDAIISKTLDGRITSWNAGAERIFGYAEDEMLGKHITQIIPPELHGEEIDILNRLASGERIEHYETVRVAKDGTRVDISLTVSPLRDSSGTVVGASKVARDITERKRAEQVQRLLLNELNHRVKNTLATVDAIARQTLRRSSNPTEFVTSFSGRIQALARAHRLLTGNTFQGAPISQLLHDQLMLGDNGDSRISWSGPDVTLDPQSALHMALVLHELGTNARKHGALSNADGRLSIGWIVEGADRKRLVLDWKESGGPKVAMRPRSGGFGTTLIEQSLKPNGGEVTMKFEERGVSCRITLPLNDPPTALAAMGARPRQAPHALASQPRAAPRPLEDKRILIVEDEPLIAMVLIDYLTEAGCEVAGVASHVEEALKLVETLNVDAALLDANLGGRLVDEVAIALVKKGTPFAFVTGYGREALSAPFQEAMMIEKPFSQAQLMDALEKLLAPDSSSVVRLKKKT